MESRPPHEQSGFDCPMCRRFVTVPEGGLPTYRAAIDLNSRLRQLESDVQREQEIGQRDTIMELDETRVDEAQIDEVQFDEVEVGEVDVGEAEVDEEEQQQTGTFSPGPPASTALGAKPNHYRHENK